MQPTNRHIAATVLGLVLVVLVALSPGGAGSANPPTACRYGGIRYVGTTSQQQSVCFTLSPKGKVVREYAYDYLDTCGSGTSRALNPIAGVMPVTPAGVFVRTSFDGFFKGVIRAGKASGTFRQHDEDTVIASGAMACDTHVVRWTAHRVA